THSGHFRVVILPATLRGPFTRSTSVLHLIQVSSIALGLHVIATDEPQRGRVDTISHAASIRWPIGENVPEMAVAVRRSHLRAGHAVGGILQFVDIGRLDRLGEAWPAASRIIFVGRSA